jgi:serine/threonine-protein kinase
MNGRLSPDVRWLAYASDISSKFEIYIQGFPQAGSRTKVSTGGGINPRWSRDGKTLFYLIPNSALIAVDITADKSGIHIGTSKELFSGNVTSYDAMPDNQRLLISGYPLDRNRSMVSVILNWLQ